MAPVDGSLRNFGLANINHLDPVIVFTPSGPAVGTGGKLFATEPIRVPVTASDSTWEADLEPTESLLTEGIYYIPSVEWRLPGLPGETGFQRADFPDWKLFVPTGGGSFPDLIEHPRNRSMVIVSPTEPEGHFPPGTFWLQMDPADPDNPNNPANTGDLYELRKA